MDQRARQPKTPARPIRPTDALCERLRTMDCTAAARAEFLQRLEAWGAGAGRKRPAQPIRAASRERRR